MKNKPTMNKLANWVEKRYSLEELQESRERAGNSDEFERAQRMIDMWFYCNDKEVSHAKQ